MYNVVDGEDNYISNIVYMQLLEENILPMFIIFYYYDV